MLSHTLRRQLESLLDREDLPPGTYTAGEVAGYLYALAITPDVIPPSEWLPGIFGGDLPAFADREQAEQVIGALMIAFNHVNALRHRGKLRFPFDLKHLDEDRFADLMEWTAGFLDGLRLRMGIWLSRIIATDLGEDSDPVANSVGVIRALVDADYSGVEGLDRIRADFPEGLSEAEVEGHLVATFVLVLPEAVEVIQSFGEALEQRRLNAIRAQPGPAAHTRKIGRNEPCPCGSGKKYKKCCALQDADETP